MNMKPIIYTFLGATLLGSAFGEGVGRAVITADSTFYDRKEGLIALTGHVFVDDAEYKLHSERAFVFLEGTNELKRLVATGNVALTNLQRRAYGDKVTYRKDNGLVVLYGKEGAPAEIRDESKGEGDSAQIVRGKKIRFWVDREQVEVENAEISGPSGGGMGELKEVIKSK